MQIYIASDHAGFELKNHLFSYIESLGFTIIDKGPFSFNPDDDYPDYVRLVADEVVKDPHNIRGIILGKSGQGEAMMANRFKDVRAVTYYGGNPEIVTLSRGHNDANVLSLAAGFLSNSEAEEVVKIWLEAPFSGDERHRRRIRKLDELS